MNDHDRVPVPLAAASEPAALAAASDASLFGGKASQLAAAIAAALPVPEGFALAWPFVDRVAAGDASACVALARAWDAMAGPVAVRSSAVGEDSAQASFAGVHETVLGVSGEAALAAAVVQVRGSGSAAGALAYRAARGQGSEPRVAVVVQRQLAPEVAGVLFTRHPVTGADERVIEAAWGLGEVIVGGLVTPDHLRVSREGSILEQRLGEKDLMIRVAVGGGTEELETPPERVNAPCLDAARVAALLDLAGRCEAARDASAGLDLEWCFADGRLWLLQQRPMTTSRRGTA